MNGFGRFVSHPLVVCGLGAAADARNSHCGKGWEKGTVADLLDTKHTETTIPAGPRPADTTPKQWTPVVKLTAGEAVCRGADSLRQTSLQSVRMK